MHPARMWAIGAVRRRPERSDYIGLSAQQARERANAIREAGEETGQTDNAALYLYELDKIIRRTEHALQEGRKE